MVTQTISLPPSNRDFAVYRRVKVDRCSTREAALGLQLSQTRICQILTRVDEYLGALLLSADNDEDRRRDTLIAEQIAAEQVESLNRQALLAFRRSQAQVITIQEGEDGQPEEVLKWTKVGDPRYLLTAAKLALYQTKLPTPKLSFLAPAPEDLPEEDEFAESDALSDEPTDLESPPVEDCSAAGATKQVAPTTAVASPATAIDGEPSCVQGVSAQLVAKLNAAAPVQQLSETPVPRDLEPNPKERDASGPAGSAKQQQARRRFFGP